MLMFIPRQQHSFVVYRGTLSLGVIYTDEDTIEVRFFQHSASVSHAEMVEIINKMKELENARTKTD